TGFCSSSRRHVRRNNQLRQGHRTHQEVRRYGGFKKTDSVRCCRGEPQKNWTFSGRTIFIWGMPKPLRLPGIEEQHLLNGLEIELVLEADPRDRWNQLVVEQHYLHNATLVGEQLRYVVSYQKQWLA